MAKPNGYVYRYRLVAAEKIGRALTSTDIVHHKNGDHSDDRPENLDVMSRSEHARHHSNWRTRHA